MAPPAYSYDESNIFKCVMVARVALVSLTSPTRRSRALAAPVSALTEPCPLPPPPPPPPVRRKILDGDIPSTKIFETEHSLAILDAFPSTPGHSLLIPKALVRNSLDMR